MVAGGIVSGTWLIRGAEIKVTWFPENRAPSREALDDQVKRIATMTGRPLSTNLHNP